MATKSSGFDREAYDHEMVKYLKNLYTGELWAGCVPGYWMYRIPLDPDLEQLRFKMGKTAYDEVRHARIVERMLRNFGGDEAVEELHTQLKHDDWLEKMNVAFCEGPEDWIEYLTTLPLLADGTGIYIFASFAEHSPDPLWSDAAESISQDERLHGSIGPEAIPIAIEKYGDEAIESLQRGLERWMPALFGVQGHPDSPARQRMIDRGCLDLTNEEVHELMWETLYDVFDPYDEVTVPEMDEEDYLRAEEIADYSIGVARGEITPHLSEK